MSELEAVALGRAIKVRRTELGLKRRDLADAVKLSYPYISEIENGVKEPSYGALGRIAEALRLDTSTLLELSERYAAGEELLVDDRATATFQAEALQTLADRPQASSTFVDSSTADDVEDRIRVAVRRELESWAAHRLPDLVRAELRRLGIEDRS